MRRWVAVAALVMALVAGASGQTAPRMEWVHDGLNLSRFEVIIDDGVPVSLGKPTPIGQTYGAPLPTLTAGTHSLVIRACYDNGTVSDTTDDLCTAAAPIVVVKL